MCVYAPVTIEYYWLCNYIHLCLEIEIILSFGALALWGERKSFRSFGVGSTQHPAIFCIFLHLFAQQNHWGNGRSTAASGHPGISAWPFQLQRFHHRISPSREGPGCWNMWENCITLWRDVLNLPFSQAGEVDMGNNCQCPGDKGEEPGRSWLVHLTSRNMSNPLSRPHSFSGGYGRACFEIWFMILREEPTCRVKRTCGAGGFQSFLTSAQRHSRCGPRGRARRWNRREHKVFLRTWWLGLVWIGAIGTVSANGNTFQQMSGKKCVCLIGRLWKSFESGKRGPVEGIRLFSGAAKQGAGRVPIRSGLSLQWCRTGVDSLYQYLIPILPYFTFHTLLLNEQIAPQIWMNMFEVTKWMSSHVQPGRFWCHLSSTKSKGCGELKRTCNLWVTRLWEA